MEIVRADVPNVPPTRMFVSVIGVVIVLAAARLNTVPLTATLCVARLVSAKALLEPLETSRIACVPVTTPAVPLLAEPPRPIAKLELLVEPAARLEKVPELVDTAPIPVPNPAFRPSV